MRRARVEVVKKPIETFISSLYKKVAVGILDKIKREENSALAFTVRLTPLVTEALRDIQSALSLVAQARGHANNVLRLDQIRGYSPAEIVRIAHTARDEYFELKRTLLLLRDAVRGTDNAIRVMNGCINPLKAIEQHSRQLERDLRQVKAPSGQRQIAFEEGIFSLSKNVSSGIQLNLQRCKAIRAQLTNFLAQTKKLPRHYAAPLSLIERIGEELAQLQRWYTAVFNSIHQVNAVVNRIAELETTILKQTVLMR